MVSGYSVSGGGRGRCFPFWQRFMECAKQPGGNTACTKLHEDYVECLHHLKLSKRLARIDAEMKKKAAAGKLPAEVDDLLHKDIKTGIDLS